MLCEVSIVRPLNTSLPLAGVNDKTKHSMLDVLQCAKESCTAY